MPKFAKGKSGNPAGRPAGSKSLVSKELEKIAKAGRGNRARLVALKLFELAEGGNVPAAKLLLERLEGRVPSVEELAKRAAGEKGGKLSPEQIQQKIIALLRQPELRGIAEKATKTESVN